MKKGIGLVLEGGGMRCIYSCGMLDYFMEQDLYFPYVISVSAGAFLGMNYIARQIGRSKKCCIDYIKKHPYISWKNAFLKGSLFDMELLFDTLPNKELPFDYDTFFAAEEKLVMAVSDCELAKPMYITGLKDRKLLMDYCRASNSLPLVSKIVTIKGRPLMDGGMLDAIPIRKSIADGNHKNVIILTQQAGYRKSPTKKSIRLARLKYKKYPEFVKQMEERPDKYNETLDFIGDLEEKGEAFVIRPEIPPVGTATQKVKKLKSFYEYGYAYAKKIFPELLAFLDGR